MATKTKPMNLDLNSVFEGAASQFRSLNPNEPGQWPLLPKLLTWAVVAALPFTIPLTLLGLAPVSTGDPRTAWLGFAYLSIVSMYLGFFAWYAGLAIGGVARVSQVQLLQPILSLTWAGLFLHEHIDALLVGVAVVVFVAVFGSRRSAIATVAPTPARALVTNAPSASSASSASSATSSR